MTDFDLNLNNWKIDGNIRFSDLEMANLIKDVQSSDLKPMDQWSSFEVLDFIRTQIEDCTEECNLEKFQSISGYIFKQLTLENCVILAHSDYLGEAIYKKKQQFCSNEDLWDCRLDNHTIKEETPQLPGKRSIKIWEFILHLLRDTKTCPHLIKWENFEEGTFKFVQNAKVAKLWGSRKKNGNMTYEKFSRAMRYYYKSEVLLPVPGKRLVYKFGPQAKGWKTMSPIN